MARYRVCFEGKWQADFGDRDDALDYGRKVGETGRLAHVVHGGFFPKLIAVFPEEMTEAGTRVWKKRGSGQGSLG